MQTRLWLKLHCHLTLAFVSQMLAKYSTQAKMWTNGGFYPELRNAVDIFKYIHLDTFSIWAFDCSSAHGLNMSKPMHKRMPTFTLQCGNSKHSLQGALTTHHRHDTGHLSPLLHFPLPTPCPS